MRGFRFVVSERNGPKVREFPPQAWYLFALRVDNDIKIENFVKRARGLIEEYGFSLDPWRLSD